jgi:hypothetical protein
MRKLLLVLLLGVPFVATVSSAATRCNASSPTRIVVDGITGEVTYPSTEHLIAHPGDIVVIGIKRADLIQYRYAIKVASKEALVTHYTIVGAGTLADAQQDLNAVSAGGGTPGASAEAIPATLQGDYVKAHAALMALRDEVTDSIAALQQTERDIESGIADCAWPNTLATASSNYLAKAGTGPSSYLARARKLRDDLQDILRQLHIDGKTYDASFESLVTGDQTAVASLIDSVETGRAVVNRWTTITVGNPVPYVELRIPINDTSNAFTIEITRAAVSGTSVPAAAGAPAAAAAAAADPPFATVNFESHAASRMGVAIGMAAIGKPDDRTYDLVRSLTSDNKVTVHVRETKRSRLDLKPVASINWYTNPVDSFALQRPPQFLVLAGAEVSSDPKTYLLGAGFDFSGGALLTFGITRYTRTKLATGWTPGQEVPLTSDGTTTVISAVPTRTSDALGYFVSFQLRPAIFARLAKLLKPGT